MLTASSLCPSRSYQRKLT